MKSCFDKIRFIGILLLITFLLSACATMGPKVLPQNKQGYNIALQTNSDQQLLLNIVRLHYGASPYFVGVTNVASQLEFGAAMSANYGASQSRTARTSGLTTGFSYGASGGVNYIERPTISYVPLQGQKFTQQILAPISMKNIYLLISSGWSIARVFRLTIQRLGPLPNAPSASRPTSKHVPIYRNFVEFAHTTLRKLQRDQDLEISAVKVNKQFGIEIRFLKYRQHRKIIRHLFHLLGVHRSYPQIILVKNGLAIKKPYILPIKTRSFMGVLYFVSKSVDTPSSAIKRGVVATTTDDYGKAFDWSHVTRGMLHVYFSKLKPANAMSLINYRNGWFYIDDSDNDSKSTMALLHLLFSLQSSDVQGVMPVLTLSV